MSRVVGRTEKSLFYELRDLLLSDPEGALSRLRRDRALLDVRSGLGETLMHWMAVENVHEVVVLLLDLGAEVDPVNHFGSTPLQEAVLLGNTEVCLTLLARGASVMHRDHAGDSVISSAVRLKRHVELVRALLERVPAEMKLFEVLWEEEAFEGVQYRDDPVGMLFWKRVSEERGRDQGITRMRVSLIATDGPWLEALVATPFGNLVVMDEFSIDARFSPAIGSEFEAELTPFLDGLETWESMFSGNPAREKKLEWVEGWSYRAYGEVVSISPVVVDCGWIRVSGVLHTHDPAVKGEYVSFMIARLDCTLSTVGSPE